MSDPLSSDFLFGNILDKQKELATKIAELERARGLPAGSGTTVYNQGTPAPRTTARWPYLQDSDTGEWWRFSVREINGVERVFIQRVDEREALG